MEKLIWRVRVEDEQYTGMSENYLMMAKTAGEVEKRALKTYKKRDADLAKGERPHKPFIRSVELIGGLDD